MIQKALFDDRTLSAHGNAGLIPIAKRQMLCAGCSLHSSRKTVVFGEGNSDSPLLMFVGEAPGATEDETGKPFVGRAGQLLDKMLQALHLSREEVYITNILCCRPPGNRAPEPEEMVACSPYLVEKIRAVDPRGIVALGATAAKFLVRSKQGIHELRGQRFRLFREEKGIQVVCTYHPAFLLRSPDHKPHAWVDLQEAAKMVGLPL